MEILSINIKLKNLTWLKSDPLKSISKSAEKTEKGKKNCIVSKHSPYFLKLPERNGAKIVLIVHPKFPVFPSKCSV